MTQKIYKKFPINENVTIQMVSYTDQLMVARFWFTGPGFASTHHHPNEETNVILGGRFEATNGDQKRLMAVGESIQVAPNVEHNMSCLTPAGEMLSAWTPARQDLLKYAELE